MTFRYTAVSGVSTTCEEEAFPSMASVPEATAETMVTGEEYLSRFAGELLWPCNFSLARSCILILNMQELWYA